MELQEQHDHSQSNEIRKQAFNAMRNSLRMSPDELKNSGFKTNEQAAIAMFKYYSSKIEQLTIEHLNKYRDER